jgi:hypothetical protein
MIRVGDVRRIRLRWIRANDDRRTRRWLRADGVGGDRGFERDLGAVARGLRLRRRRRYRLVELDVAGFAHGPA